MSFIRSATSCLFSVTSKSCSRHNSSRASAVMFFKSPEALILRWSALASDVVARGIPATKNPNRPCLHSFFEHLAKAYKKFILTQAARLIAYLHSASLLGRCMHSQRFKHTAASIIMAALFRGAGMIGTRSPVFSSPSTKYLSILSPMIVTLPYTLTFADRPPRSQI